MTAATIRGHNRYRAPQEPDFAGNRCLLAVQGKVRGFQELRVDGASAQVTGRKHGVISVRVGQVLLYLEDREALYSWVAAIQRAVELQDLAYGPDLPPARLGPARLDKVAG